VTYRELEAERMHHRVLLSEAYNNVERLKRRLHDAETYVDGAVSASAKAIEDVMLAVHNGQASAVYELVETYGDCRARAVVASVGALPSYDICNTDDGMMELEGKPGEWLKRSDVLKALGSRECTTCGHTAAEHCFVGAFLDDDDHCDCKTFTPKDETP
jgi:hypothetical protein